jgi:broad specificity phosphatase PhoE
VITGSEARMTELLLIRHGHTEAVGHRLVGRLPNVLLDARGREEAARLAAHLAGTKLRAVYSSPLERAFDTARAVAEPHGLEVERRDGLNELDFGEWTGALIETLGADEANRRFNVHRAGNRAAGGEYGVEVQARMVRELAELRDRHPDDIIAVVGHSDPLRTAVAHFVGVPLDFARRLELDTGSITRLDLWPEGASLRYLNRIP